METAIITEKSNQNTTDIDISSTLQIVRMINNEDLTVAQKIKENLGDIAKAVDVISDNFRKGGRLFYFGAGTSGRLGVLDASECPPTFGVTSGMVQGVIAGGDRALRYAIEGAEDSIDLAQEDFFKFNITTNDTIVVISASGNADYCVEILKLAKENDIKTIALTCNSSAKMKEYADISIIIETGAEVISGSTRMKAGTAQKMVLNMLTTASMVKIGKTYKNFMVDVMPTNEKLKKRALRIVSELASCSEKQAKKILENNSYHVKEAILQLKYLLTYEKAHDVLIKNDGVIRKVFENYPQEIGSR